MARLKQFCLQSEHFEQMWARRRFDVYLYWRHIGAGEMPEDVGACYCEEIAKHGDRWDPHPPPTSLPSRWPSLSALSLPLLLAP